MPNKRHPCDVEAPEDLHETYDIYDTTFERCRTREDVNVVAFKPDVVLPGRSTCYWFPRNLRYNVQMANVDGKCHVKKDWGGLTHDQEHLLHNAHTQGIQPMYDTNRIH